MVVVVVVMVAVVVVVVVLVVVGKTRANTTTRLNMAKSQIVNLTSESILWINLNGPGAERMEIN